MLNNKSLLKRFLIYSFLAFVITGVTLSKLISNHIRNNMFNGVGDMALEDLTTQLDELNRIIAFVITLGLLMLYLLLLRIIFKASKDMVSQNKELHEQKQALEISYQKLNSSYKSTIKTLSNAIDARDPYTLGHSERVTSLSLKIGRNLGLDKDQLYDLELAALFHDIGKIGIPDKILHKPGKLTEDEYCQIKSHPVIGVNILENVDYISSIIPMILHHHESTGGGGYPDGLKDEEIPLGSRIIAVADTYDAMTSDRPYRNGISKKDAIAELIRFKGIQFDPSVVDAFIEIHNNID